MADRDPNIVLDDATAIEDLTQAVQTEAPSKAVGRWRRFATMGIVPLLIIAGAVTYWQSLQGKVSTDNAYVQQDKVSVSAEVGGKIVSVMVKEGQQVKAGDVLFVVDQQPFQIQLAQADAAIASAQANATVARQFVRAVRG